MGRRKRTSPAEDSVIVMSRLPWWSCLFVAAVAFVILHRSTAADGGVGLELMKAGERYLVQAKHWRAKQVPVEVVRELAGVMPFRRASVATS